ncbi:hypothetical protein EDC04DRAFT_2882888 [Pisolithus marmoratus]|nr:hypothetical protein EDC04DRAFT_2882888 [Pisolithus marmoratus]
MASIVLPPGTAPIKTEFLLHLSNLPVTDDDAAEGSTSHVGRGLSRLDANGDSAPGGHKKFTKEQKKAQRGANKDRRFGMVRDELELCWWVANGTICEHGSECRFTHDIDTYLAAKPKDIYFPPASALRETQPFVVDDEPPQNGTKEGESSLHFGTTCTCFNETGECHVGLKCRFFGAHAHKGDDGVFTLVVDEQKKSRVALTTTELNHVSQETLKIIRTWKYLAPVADTYLRELEAVANAGGDVDVPQSQENEKGDDVGSDSPFQRLCVSLSADITCSEMGLATSFLAASHEEWSLVHCHSCESIFRVQLAGNKPSTIGVLNSKTTCLMVPTAEILGKEFTGGIDSVDINCGCPIDLLGKIIIGMNKVLGDIPVTVKLHTGVKDGHNMAHKLMPRLSTEWGVGCITLHGRTQQQQYTKIADWDYIQQCVEAVRVHESEEGSTGVDSVMISRGALIKLWIFTEIKEHSEWDISSREHLELIRKLAECGLSHFGMDMVGVNTARWYLCEVLYFQYHYIPIGLLECLPMQIYEHTPAFRGRDELEALLVSLNSQDWVRVSEMFLGPAPETWSFTPKHKSNAYQTCLHFTPVVFCTMVIMAK